MRKDAHPAFCKHAQAHLRITEEVFFSDFILHDRFQFVEPAMFLYAVKKEFVEHPCVLLSLTILLHGYLSQGVEDVGDVYVVGTAHGTCRALETCPDSPGRERLFPVTEYDMTNDPVGVYIHVSSDRATIGALVALIAGSYLFT